MNANETAGQSPVGEALSSQGAVADLIKMLDRVTEEIMMGLITDGAHHKQHHLERALRIIGGKEFADKAKDKFQWVGGVPS